MYVCLIKFVTIRHNSNNALGLMAACPENTGCSTRKQLQQALLSGQALPFSSFLSYALQFSLFYDNITRIFDFC